MNKKFLIIGMVLVFLITLGGLIFFNKKQDNQQAKKLLEQIKPIDGVEGVGLSNLPVVDQEELKKKYETSLKQFLAELDGEINTVGGINNLSSEKIKDLKNRVAQEVVPTDYREIHLNFILAMGMIIGGDFDKAQIKLEDIKKKI